MPFNNQRQISLLLVLAALGVALLLYRLSASNSRISKTAPIKHVPATGNTPKRHPYGRHIWNKRVVGVGDLHGDLHNAQIVLKMAGIIDDEARWQAGETTLVQTGDIVDRGTDTIALYKMMQSLRSQAPAHGGQVVSILGNHEIMNAIGDWRYVTPDDIKTFGGSRARQDALSSQGWLGQEWLANYTVTARVPLSPYDSPDHYLAFSHGSLKPNMSILLPFPSGPNKIGQHLLEAALTKPMPLPYPPNSYPGMPRGTGEAEKLLYGADGPLWWRGLAIEDNEATVCAWARSLQDDLGVRRMIGGHTPNFNQIVHRCDGDVIIIDTGISKAYGGVLSALEITYDLYEQAADVAGLDDGQETLSTKDALRSRTKFVEVEVVHALYARGKVQLDRREEVVEFETSRPAVQP